MTLQDESQSRLAAMGEMIGNIAHQWKQPLNALNILLYNIKDCFDSDEREPELLDNFVEKGTDLVMKMASTIDDFRYFFKPNKKKEKFCINKSINDSLALVNASLKHNNISLISSLKGELVVVGFPNEYSQVILNILNNAKDAIIAKGVEGKIKIETCLESGSAVVKITDNAGGIPEKILNRVFDPYFTTKREERGTGIGLYMSKMIIEEHMSGQIKVHNTTDGAEFTIITPILIS
jgi:signal transduction histidine kinase